LLFTPQLLSESAINIFCMPEKATVKYFKEEDVILPGSQAEVAKWIAENNADD